MLRLIDEKETEMRDMQKHCFYSSFCIFRRWQANVMATLAGRFGEL